MGIRRVSEDHIHPELFYLARHGEQSPEWARVAIEESTAEERTLVAGNRSTKTNALL